MIYVAIIISLLVLTELITSKDKFKTIKQMYLYSWQNWALALCTVIGVFSIFIFTYDYIPDFLKWGWTNLVSDTPVNIIAAPLIVTNKLPVYHSFHFEYLGIFAFYIIMSIMLPVYALAEEKMFRHEVHKWSKIIIKSLIFGFFHMLVGISIYVALILSVVGFIYHLKYKYVFVSWIKKGTHIKFAEDKALISSASMHACYNFILFTILCVTYFLIVGK